MAAERASGL